MAARRIASLPSSNVTSPSRLYARAAIASAVWLAIAPLLSSALIVRAESHNPDAIVVLSGAPVYMERLNHAARLYREGRGGVIILTNDGLRGPWSARRQSNPLSFERGIERLVSSGVPADRVVVLSEVVTSTYDEVIAVRKYAAQENLRSILVVTSPYHSRRALWVFRRHMTSSVHVGLDTPPPGQQSPSRVWWWLSRRGWYDVALEYVKFAYYVFRHWSVQTPAAARRR